MAEDSSGITTMDDLLHEQQEVVSELKVYLDSKQQEKLEHVFTCIKEKHLQELDRLAGNHKHDLAKQMDSIRSSMEQVQSGQSDMLHAQMDLDRLTALREQQQKLTREHGQHIIKLEADWESRIEDLQMQLALRNLKTGEENSRVLIDRLMNKLDDEQAKFRESIIANFGISEEDVSRDAPEASKELLAEYDQENIKDIGVIWTRMLVEYNQLQRLRAEFQEHIPESPHRKNSLTNGGIDPESFQREKERLIADYDKQLSEKDETINNLVSKFALAEREICDLTLSIGEFENKVKSLNELKTVIDLSNNEIAELKVMLDQKENIIDELDNRIQSDSVVQMLDENVNSVVLKDLENKIDYYENHVQELELKHKNLICELQERIELQKTENLDLIETMESQKLHIERIDRECSPIMSPRFLSVPSFENAFERLPELSEYENLEDNNVHSSALFENVMSIDVNTQSSICDSPTIPIIPTVENGVFIIRTEDLDADTDARIHEALVNFEEEKARELEDLHEKYKFEINNLKAELQSIVDQRDEVEFQHARALDDIREDIEHEHHIEIDTLQAELQIQLSVELKRCAADLDMKHDETLKDMSDKYDHELQEMCKIHDDDVEKLDKFEKELRNLQEKYEQDSKDSSQQQREEKLDLVEENRGADVNVIEAKHREELKEMRESHYSELQEAFGEHEKDVKELTDKYKDELNRVIEKYEDEFHEMEKQHDGILAEKEKKYETDLKSAKDKHDEEQVEIQEKHEHDIRNMEEMHKDAITILEETHEEDIRKVEESHQDELKSIKEQMNAHLSSVTDTDKDEVDVASQDLYPAEKEKLQREISDMYEQRMKDLILEWEENVEKAKLELVEQHEDEHADVEKKHGNDILNLKEQLADLQEEHSKLIEALDSGSFESPALTRYRESLQEKVDLELEMARTLLQSEYEDTKASLEEYNKEEIEQEKADLVQVSESEMAALKQEYERKLEELSQDLVSAHTDQIDAVHLLTQTATSDLDAAHEQELRDLEDDLMHKHAKELNNLEQQYKSKLEEAEVVSASMREKLQTLEDNTVSLKQTDHSEAKLVHEPHKGYKATDLLSSNGSGSLSELQNVSGPLEYETSGSDKDENTNDDDMKEAYIETKLTLSQAMLSRDFSRGEDNEGDDTDDKSDDHIDNDGDGMKEAHIQAKRALSEILGSTGFSESDDEENNDSMDDARFQAKLALSQIIHDPAFPRVSDDKADDKSDNEDDDQTDDKGDKDDDIADDKSYVIADDKNDVLIDSKNDDLADNKNDVLIDIKSDDIADDKNDVLIDIKSDDIADDHVDGDRSCTPVGLGETLCFSEAQKLAEMGTLLIPVNVLTDTSGSEADKSDDTVDNEKDEQIKQLKGQIERLQAEVNDFQIKMSEINLDTTPEPATETDAEQDDGVIARNTDHYELEKSVVEEEEVLVSIQSSPLHTRPGEGDDLMRMLQSDLDRISAERDAIQSTNHHLLLLLSDSLNAHVYWEDVMNKRLAKVVSATAKATSPFMSHDDNSRDSDRDSSDGHGRGANGSDYTDDQKVAQEQGDVLGAAQAGVKDEEAGSPREPSRSPLPDDTEANLSALSAITDEGLDLSQRISADSLFTGPELDAESEELLKDARSRLQTSLSRLLDMIEDTSQQLLEAKRTQQQLLETLAEKSEHIAQIAERCDELEEKLREEEEAKDYLSGELNKAESLIEGYASEKDVSQERITELEEKEMALIVDVETLRKKLQNIQSEQADLTAMREDLRQQRQALESNVSDEHQETKIDASVATDSTNDEALLQEINRVNDEKRELTKQWEREHERAQTRIHELEHVSEEMEKRHEEFSTKKAKEIDDLKHQVEALDKQLKANRQFLEDQAVDREQEREEHQKELMRVNQILSVKQRRESTEFRLQQEVEDLNEELSYKKDEQTEIQGQKEQMQAEMQELKLANEEKDGRLRSLDNEVEQKVEQVAILHQKIVRLQDELKRQRTDSDGSSSESNKSGSPEELRRQIKGLEEQLEAKERTIYQSRTSLEEELRKAKNLTEELTGEKDLLRKQVYDQLMQISALKTQLDEHRYRNDTASALRIEQLQSDLGVEREGIDRKQAEVQEIEKQLDQFRDQVIDKDEQLEQLSQQLRVANLQIIQLEGDLKREITKNRDQIRPSLGNLPESLLEEKNVEITYLETQLSKLQHERSMEEEESEIEKMRKELTSKQSLLESQDLKIAELQDTLVKLQDTIDPMLDTTVSDDHDLLMSSLTERVSIQDELTTALSIKEDEVDTLKKIIEERETELTQLQERHGEELTYLNDQIQEKESSIDQLTVQVGSLQTEVENLTEFQTKLQDDFDMVQSMLEEKQKEVEHLSQEAAELRPQGDGASETLLQLELQIDQLKKDLIENKNTVGEKEEELYELNEKLELQEEEIKNLKEQNRDVIKLADHLKEKEDQLATAQLELMNLQRVHSNTKENNIHDEGLSQRRQDEMHDLERELFEANAESDHLRTEIEEYRSRLSDRDAEIQDIRTTLEQVRREAESMKQSLELHRNVINSGAGGDGERLQQLADELDRAKLQLKQQEATASMLSGGDLEEGEVSMAEVRRLRLELHEAQDELNMYKEDADAVNALEIHRRVSEIRDQCDEEHQERLSEFRDEAERELDRRLSQQSHQHQKEIVMLKENQQRLLQLHKDEMEALHREEIQQLISIHRQELDQLRARTIIPENMSMMDVGEQLQSEICVADDKDKRLMDHISRQQRRQGVGQDDPDQTGASVEPSLSEMSLDTDLPDIPDRLRVLMTRLHNEGVQTLTLSDLQYIKRHSSPSRVEKEADISALQSAWDGERQGFLSAVQALKDLLAKVQQHRTSSDKSSERSVSDWRSDLINAISNVFAREREVLLAELRTQVAAHPSTEVERLQDLEQKLNDQNELHKAALNMIFSADRQSLMAELRDIHAHANTLRAQLQDETRQLNRQLSSLDSQTADQERLLKRKIELLEYRSRQDQIVLVDIRNSLEVEKARAIELASQLAATRSRTLDMESEYDLVQRQLVEACESLDREKSRNTSVIGAYDNEKAKCVRLEDILDEAKTERQQMKNSLQEERARTLQQHSKDKQLIQKLHEELEREKDRLSDINSGLEKERVLVKSLRRELDLEEENARAVERDYKSRLNQLEAALERENARIIELSNALDRERQLGEQLSRSLDQERGIVIEAAQRQDNAVIDLQALLDAERSKVQEQQAALSNEKQHAASTAIAVEEARVKIREELEKQRLACRGVKRELDALQSQHLELSRHHSQTQEDLAQLRRERDQVRIDLNMLQRSDQERERVKEREILSERRKQREVERERDDARLKLHEQDLELQRLQQKVMSIEARRSPPSPQKTNSDVTISVESDHVDARAYRSAVSSPQSGRELTDEIALYRSQLLSLCQKLQHLTAKCSENLDTHERSSGESHALKSVFRAFHQILSELRDLQDILTSQMDPNNISSTALSVLNERVLAHNTELTRCVTELTDEKTGLRKKLHHLEDEYKKMKASRAEITTNDIANSLLIAERANWTQEKLSLQMSLEQADREISRLKVDLQAVHDRSSRIMARGDSAALDSDKEKMHRVYGKYLRSESFRKALIYQKKYLILLIGGFRDCEAETLMALARMGAYPAQDVVDRRTRHSKSFTKFRTAARVVIAIHRMHFLVRKWRRATKVGSPVVMSNHALHQGYVPGDQSFSPPHGTVIPRAAPHTEYTSSLRTQGAAYLTPPTRDMAGLGGHRIATSLSTDNWKSNSVTPAKRKLLSETDESYDVLHSPSNRRHAGATVTSSQSLDENYMTRLSSLQHRVETLGATSSPTRGLISRHPRR